MSRHFTQGIAGPGHPVALRGGQAGASWSIAHTTLEASQCFSRTLTAVYEARSRVANTSSATWRSRAQGGCHNVRS